MKKKKQQGIQRYVYIHRHVNDHIFTTLNSIWQHNTQIVAT